LIPEGKGKFNANTLYVTWKSNRFELSVLSISLSYRGYLQRWVQGVPEPRVVPDSG
jgi:hypothetical protein